MALPQQGVFDLMLDFIFMTVCDFPEYVCQAEEKCGDLMFK